MPAAPDVFAPQPHIRVNEIYVGSVLSSALEFVAGVPEMKAELEHATALGRIGEAEDIAAAVVYLASLPASTSPARCWRSTAGSRSPTSTSSCRTSSPPAGRRATPPRVAG